MPNNQGLGINGGLENFVSSNTSGGVKKMGGSKIEILDGKNRGVQISMRG